MLINTIHFPKQNKNTALLKYFQNLLAFSVLYIHVLVEKKNKPSKMLYGLVV